jgi:DNA-binding winged helix-turn-helix (wHTH) protein/tetratricopeptide (TPR) repeat protein
MCSSGNKPRLYEFGPFRLHVEERVLWHDGRLVRLTPKVFDTLLFLVERRGRLVRREEFIEGLWPDSFVEERNLAQNIFLLRKALGDGERGRRYIQTVPKVGYRFIAEVHALPRARGVEGDDDDDGSVDSAAAQGADCDRQPKAGARRRAARPFVVLAGLVLVALCSASALLIRRSAAPAHGRGVVALRGADGRANPGTKTKAANPFMEAGLHLWNQRTPDGIKKSVVYFQKAIEREPNDALAYASLADSYYLIHFYGLDGFADGEAYRKSVEAALASLERDPSLAEAHSAMAMILRLNSQAAEVYFRRSIDLDPSLPTTRHRYGQFLIRNGRLDEGLAELRRAHELAPTSLAINRALVRTLFLSRHYDEAIELCLAWLDVDPNDLAARVELVMSYIQKDMRAAAEAELGRLENSRMGRLEALRMASYMNARSGNSSVASGLARLFETEAQGWPYYSAFNLAVINAAMGREEEALRYLCLASDLSEGGPESQKEDFLSGLHFDPQLDPLRGAGRFEQLRGRRPLR